MTNHVFKSNEGNTKEVYGRLVPQDKSDHRRRSGYCYYVEKSHDEIETISAMQWTLKEEK